MLGIRRADAVCTTGTQTPADEAWVQSLLEELRTPEAERTFAAHDMDVLFASRERMRALVAPFIRQGER
jgi:hypothetical protein